MLALAMRRWNLHRRIALLRLSLMGSKPVNLIAGFMIATGFLSMWVSNTATAVMMLPIGISVLMLVQKIPRGEDPGPVSEPADEEEAAEEKKEAIRSTFGTAAKLPWGVLLLFGGGLALSGQFGASGLSDWLGTQMEGLAGIPVWVLVLIAAGGMLFLTEMTLHTATAATFLPVASGVAMGTGVDPLVLAAPVALAATCAFMLPVATPPHAIAYGSGYVTVGQMVKGGFWLNILSLVTITLVSMRVLVWVFGLSM